MSRGSARPQAPSGAPVSHVWVSSGCRVCVQCVGLCAAGRGKAQLASKSHPRHAAGLGATPSCRLRARRPRSPRSPRDPPHGAHGIGACRDVARHRRRYRLSGIRDQSEISRTGRYDPRATALLTRTRYAATTRSRLERTTARRTQVKRPPTPTSSRQRTLCYKHSLFGVSAARASASPFAMRTRAPACTRCTGPLRSSACGSSHELTGPPIGTIVSTGSEVEGRMPAEGSPRRCGV